MPFESGNFALTIFRLPNKMPENYLELFTPAGKFDDVGEEPQVGWVSGRHLLETRIDEQTAIRGGHLYLNMRTAERKIPTTLLNAICRREELVYMQANETIVVPSKVRKEIKEEALEKNLRRFPPTLTAIPVVIDLASDMLYLGTGSLGQIDAFIAFFLNCVEVEPMQIDMDEMAHRLFQIDSIDLPPINLTPNFSEEDSPPARDFLTWLWYYSETSEGKANVDNFGEFSMMLEGPLTFAFGAEAKGAGESSVKKGSPLRSAEAKAALSVGKKLKKAKITLVREEDIWSGTFDADKFSFSGLALPEGEEMEVHSRFAERVNNLHILQLALQAYFKVYVDTIRGENWPEVEKDMVKWIQERDSF